MKAALAQVVSCCVYDKPPKIIWLMQQSLHVRLLGKSGCSFPTKELHGLEKL